MRRLILSVVLLLAFCLAGCGDSGPTPLTADQSSRRDAVARAVSQAGVTVDPTSDQYPDIFRIRLPRHDISTGDARMLAKTTYERLGTPFAVTVYDDTDKKLAQADESGVRD